MKSQGQTRLHFEPVPDSGNKPMRLVLVDDHRIVLGGLCYLLELEPDIQVLAECVSGSEGLAAVQRLRPDILVLDLLMPGLDGLDILRALQDEPDPPRVLLLTAAIGEDEMIRAVGLGVSGVILKEMAPRQLVQCLRKIHGGGTWLEQDAVARALRKLVHGEVAPEAATASECGLTPRELEVVRLVGAGLANKQIARRVNITEGTVKQHLHHIYDKLGVQGRINLVRHAQEKGLL